MTRWHVRNFLVAHGSCNTSTLLTGQRVMSKNKKRQFTHVYESSHAYDLCHTVNKSCRIFERGILHVCMSFVTQVNQAISNKWMKHFTHVYESCHTCTRVHGTNLHLLGVSDVKYCIYFHHMNNSCRAYEWGMVHMCMSHVTHVHEFMAQICTS